MLKRRIVTLILTIVLALSAAQFVCAAEGSVKLDAALKDETNWNAPKEEVVFKDSALTHTAPEGVNSVFGYTKEKYLNEAIEFDAIFNVVGAEVWQGIMLRSSSPTALPWLWQENKNYLVVITEHQIELQRFNYKSGYLAVVPNPFKAGERVNIQFAAINIEQGVQLIFKVNGKTLINVIDDNEAQIRDAGHVGFFNPSTITILPSTRNAQNDVPSVVSTKIDGKGITGKTLTASYIFNDLDGGTEGESIYHWYRTLAPIDAFGYGRNKPYPENFKEEYLEEIKGANEKTYTVTEDDSSYYLLFGVQPRTKETGALGEESLSNVIYVNHMDNILAGGIYFAANSPYASVYGEKVEIDPENEKFTPFEHSGELYIPLRFTAEKTGCTVTWDNATKTATILKDGEIKKIYKAEELINKFNSLFMPITEAGEILGIKSAYEPLYELGVISNTCAGLNPVDYKVILRTVKNAVAVE
ncbi:MAG: hypothetical protein IKA17_05430 [Clostridia bacterium]|nr:hypothetical protein [Clostridia bacterium]